MFYEAEVQNEEDKLSELSFAFVRKKNNLMFSNLDKEDLKNLPELDWKASD